VRGDPLFRLTVVRTEPTVPIAPGVRFVRFGKNATYRRIGKRPRTDPPVGPSEELR